MTYVNVLRAECKTSRKSLIKQIREAKKTCWAHLCHELDNDIWSESYKIITKTFGKLTPYEMDTGEKRHIVTEVFSTVIHSWDADGVVIDVNTFTIAELEIAAQSMKVGKAAGNDSIPPEAIKGGVDPQTGKTCRFSEFIQTIVHAQHYEQTARGSYKESGGQGSRRERWSARTPVRLPQGEVHCPCA